MHVACCAALLEKIGRCIVLAHSLGATTLWPLVQRNPDAVAAMVAIEPNGPPFVDVPPVGDGLRILRDWGISYLPLQFDPPVESSRHLLELCRETHVSPHRLRGMQASKVLVVTGSASYHAAYDGQTVDFLRRFGVEVEHMLLADHGLAGNGHMMMLESNSADIAACIGAWMESAA